MSTLLFAALEKAGLDDEVYIGMTARNSGTFVRELHAYFKSWDKDYGLVSLSLAQDSNRVIVISQGAISWIKSALTGEMIYQKDSRATIFGEAI